MIRHYFKLAKKTLVKNKYYTLINVVGLVCGMLSVLIISKYVGSSLQYDQFHVLKNRILRINQQETIEGNEQDPRSSTYWGVGDAVSEFPEVTSFTRYNQHVEALVIADAADGSIISILESRIFITDSVFLKMFSFPIIDGDRKHPLSQPKSLVLTRSASRRYFGDSSAVGKSLVLRVAWGEESVYQITGVVEDVSPYSQFKFDFLIAPLADRNMERTWDSPDYSTFVLLEQHASVERLRDKLAAKLGSEPELVSNKRHIAVSLTSIASTKLSVTEYLLVAVGIFILIVCWVNYINQVIAQSYWRIKEIGILRVLGATRANLQFQFIIESSLVCIFSFLLVLAAYMGLEQQLLTLTNSHLLPLIGDPTPITLFFCVIFILGLFVTAAIQTTILFVPNFGANLRNAFSTKTGGASARRTIVVIQFSISTILVICIFVVARQMKFLGDKDKGIDMRDVVVVRAPMAKDTTWNVKRKRLEVFKEKCAQLPMVIDVASSATVPGEEYRNETYLSMQDRTEKFLVHQNSVDDNYLRLYNVEFIAGRDFIPDAGFENNSSIILNESAALGLGIHDFENAIDTRIVDHDEGNVFNLIGIVKDYHQTGLKYKMEPTAFKFNLFRGHISMKINRNTMDQDELLKNINILKQNWAELYKDASFEYYFLESRFATMNMEDRYLGTLLYCFTTLSVVISCLGLFSMSLFISEKRQKEIGIRKVFGASTNDVLRIFFGGYLISLLVAIMIGGPIGYWLMDKWLADYSYKFDIGIGLISTAIISIVIVFFLTVTYHTLRSARANPIKILRD
ncbi:MAG TPA: FtsX-like permease family protein [Chryseolinea sp.]|nr:FtsX-like permease family protein [Chryseolinea sp.]